MNNMLKQEQVFTFLSKSERFFVFDDGSAAFSSVDLSSKSIEAYVNAAIGHYNMLAYALDLAAYPPLDEVQERAFRKHTQTYFLAKHAR